MANERSVAYTSRSLYLGFSKIADLLQPLLLLLFRLQWGWAFFQTGMGKLLNHAQVMEFFTSLGIPLPEVNAWFVGALECVGGFLLLIGLCSRPVAFLLTVNMVVAYLSVPEDRVKFLSAFTNPEPFLAADPFFFLLTSLLVLAFGAGALSVDALIGRFLRDKFPDRYSRRF